MSNTLGRIDFAARRRTVRVEIPELEGSFVLRELSSDQLDGLKADDPRKTTSLLALSIVDDDLRRIYTSEEDVANLSEMSVGTRKALSEAMATLNGFSKEAVDEAIKNSVASLSAASVSA